MLNKKRLLTLSLVFFLVIFCGVLGYYSLRSHKHVTDDGLVIEDLVVGTGAETTKGKTISFNYTGSLLKDHKQFDSSYDRGVPYTVEVGVGHAIPAWDKGIVGMKIGGKRRLTVPASLGYGEKGAGTVVPPNSDLVYEIELISIK